MLASLTPHEFISPKTENEILFYLTSYENEPLSYLVHTLLEQGYTTSEVSAGLKEYIERTIP